MPACAVPGAPRVGGGVGARAGRWGHLLLLILGGWEEACSTGCAAPGAPRVGLGFRCRGDVGCQQGRIWTAHCWWLGASDAGMCCGWSAPGGLAQGLEDGAALGSGLACFNHLLSFPWCSSFSCLQAPCLPRPPRTDRWLCGTTAAVRSSPTSSRRWCAHALPCCCASWV